MRMTLNQWESEFFARDIYRAIPLHSAEKRCWTAERPTGLVQAKVPVSDVAYVDFLQQHQFQLVETAVEFSLDLTIFREDRTACTGRIATAQDLPALKAWIGNAFPESRFRPPYFTKAENQRFYQHWIENAVAGRFDDVCLIIEKNGKQQGAVSVRIEGEQATVGLLAVNVAYRGQGIGKALIHNAVAFVRTAQADNHNLCKRLRITTQLSNLPAMRLYQSVGAKMVQSDYWFYYQPPENAIQQKE